MQISYSDASRYARNSVACAGLLITTLVNKYCLYFRIFATTFTVYAYKIDYADFKSASYFCTLRQIFLDVISNRNYYCETIGSELARSNVKI